MRSRVISTETKKLRWEPHFKQFVPQPVDILGLCSGGLVIPLLVLLKARKDDGKTAHYIPNVAIKSLLVFL